jgi:D-tyrosyl-tRNA(Tyr) deacylase
MTLVPSLEHIQIRTVLQRCSDADVFIDGESRGHLNSGLIALIGFSSKSRELTSGLLEELQNSTLNVKSKVFADLFGKWWAKVSQLRLFADEFGKMNLSLTQMPENFGMYLVSQFTLFADVKKGNRPGFSNALDAPLAQLCFEQLVDYVCQKSSERPIYSGVFGTDMRVSFVNEGPVTIMFDFSTIEGFVSL